MFVVTIDVNKCQAAGDCIDFCPHHLISMVEEDGRKHAVFSGKQEDCIGCLSCQESCPEEAVKVTEI